MVTCLTPAPAATISWLREVALPALAVDAGHVELADAARSSHRALCARWVELACVEVPDFDLDTVAIVELVVDADRILDGVAGDPQQVTWAAACHAVRALRRRGLLVGDPTVTLISALDSSSD